MEPSQFDDAGFLDFTKRIDAVGPATFMRFENEGIATEHKAAFNLESWSGTLDDGLYKRTGAFIISSWSAELPNIQA